ncbi:50S ribosomal protein L17 [Candidatus Berkelbacteria bacterium CG10_big_fil_rev_8_21_14_0_10_43_13]|uniref:50S ribosomal protein L17 n=1 Tax=Candidatus Berkelbacteria bacterium CG10_big_fil_rev_8_21_14_0_10_43_13 TaxID=1974514 RepID=A0A2H0W880_9BACT|nr:MAG: 50S ribosomal protein L17 [Candidatus Berkelbacteria bacterium CG10_big_fil_rev_8_21_14_0_10_43_13]
MKRTFSRQRDHGNHMLRNLATSLILYEKVDTTAPKAKELKSYIDHILAQSKTADLKTHRNLNTIFFDKNAVKKVVEVLIPRYTDKASGYTVSYNLKNRLGDNAAMMRVELVDKKVFIEDYKDKKVSEPTKAKKETLKKAKTDEK